MEGQLTEGISMTTQVFQVMGVSDSHPDYSDWTVATYENRTFAEQHAQLLNDFRAAVLDIDARNGNCELECALREHHPLDSKYQDNGGVVYKVEPLTLSELPFTPTAPAATLAEQFADAIAKAVAAQ
jgi:hypothetical protein